MYQPCRRYCLRSSVVLDAKGLSYCSCGRNRLFSDIPSTSIYVSACWQVAARAAPFLLDSFSLVGFQDFSIVRREWFKVLHARVSDDGID